MERAANSYSRSFNASTSPLTIRAACIQLVTPIAKTIRMNAPSSGPTIPAILSRNSMTMTKRSGIKGRAGKRIAHHTVADGKLSAPPLLPLPRYEGQPVPPWTQSVAAVSVCLSNPLDRPPIRDYLAAKSKYIGGGSGNGSAAFL